MKLKTQLLLSATPVTITINNSPAQSSPGWFWSAVTGVKTFADVHPYITYVAVGIAVGAVAYFFGGRLVRSLP